MAESPFERYLRTMAQLQKLMQGPALQLAAHQERMNRLLAGPAMAMARQQAALRDIVEGPLRALAAQQARTQQVLEGPFRDVERFQRQVGQVTSGPLQTIAKNQAAIRATMEALAAIDPWEVAAATSDAGPAVAEAAWEAQAGQWLVDLLTSVTEARPSKAQLWILIDVVTWLIAIILFFSSYTDVDAPEYPEAPLAAAALLLQGGALLYKAVDEAPESGEPGASGPPK